MINSIAWVFLPYFAAVVLAGIGAHYDKTWVIVIAVMAWALYDPKPGLEIICKRPVYFKCIFEKEQSK